MLFVQESHFKYRELTSSPRVFIDLDGTLCDFFRYFSHINYFDMRKKNISITEISPEYYRKRASIRKYIHKHVVNQKIDYWTRMPMTKCAPLLWYSLKQLKPYIFTGIVNSDPTMEMGKFKWCRKRSHLDFKNADLSRILINANRIDYAKNEDCPNILIDDDPENCLAWEQAGGIAYYYVDNQFVVERIVREVREDIIRHSHIDFMLKWDDRLERYVF